MAFELDSNNFKIRLKEVRKIRKLTQLELAEKTGIPVTSIAHFESGSRKPSLENFYKLIVVLNVLIRQRYNEFLNHFTLQLW